MDRIFVTRNPEEYADEFKRRLLALVRLSPEGEPITRTVVSEEYAEAARLDILERAVQVSSSYEANMVLSAEARNVTS